MKPVKVRGKRGTLGAPAPVLSDHEQRRLEGLMPFDHSEIEVVACGVPGPGKPWSKPKPKK